LQIVLGDFFLRHGRLLEHVVNDLVFKDRRAHLLLHLLILLNELKELALLTRVLTRLIHDRLGHLGVGHFDFGFLTQLCEQQAKTHAAGCQLAVLVRGLDLGGIVAFNFGVILVPQLVGDLARFGIQQRGRQIEINHTVQRIQKAALHHGT